MTLPRPHIAAMAPYALANVTAPSGIDPISLAQNESLRGPSPRAIEAAKAVMDQAALYPDPDWQDLRQGLARLHSLDAGSILCGAGSLDLIGCIARVYAGPDRAVLAPEHAYPFFRTAAAMAGARFDTAEETDQTVDVAKLLDGVRDDTGLVFVANPGNPTGTRIASAELRALRVGLREDILLVIDEAYGEFADDEDRPVHDLVAAGNTIILRTFSKAYGLAGHRVGWGTFPPGIGSEVRKVLNPNNISSVSQAAAAAALADQDYMRETCEITKAARTAARTELATEGFRVLPSHTNFVLIDFESEARARSADQELQSRGLILRAQGGAGLPHMLRMTMGAPNSVDRALQALRDWKKEHGT